MLSSDLQKLSVTGRPFRILLTYLRGVNIMRIIIDVLEDVFITEGIVMGV